MAVALNRMEIGMIIWDCLGPKGTRGACAGLDMLLAAGSGYCGSNTKLYDHSDGM